MDDDLHLTIKIMAAKQARSMNDLMVEAVKLYIQQRNLKDSSIN